MDKSSKPLDMFWGGLRYSSHEMPSGGAETGVAGLETACDSRPDLTASRKNDPSSHSHLSDAASPAAELVPAVPGWEPGPPFPP